VALHEDEGTVRGKLVLSTLGDVPSLLLVVLDVAVVGRDSLELDLNLSLHGSSDGEVVGLEGFKNNFLLDKVLVFIGADPGWASSEGRGITILVLDGVVLGGWSHDEESWGWGLVGGSGMGDLVEVVVDDLS